MNPKSLAFCRQFTTAALKSRKKYETNMTIKAMVQNALRGCADAVDRPRLKLFDLTAVRFPRDFEVRVGVFEGGGGSPTERESKWKV